VDELTALREQRPRWRIWTSDAGWKYAACADLIAPGSGTTVHGETFEALSNAIDQAESDAAKKREQAWLVPTTFRH
jgi:hypothetical protein